MCKYTYIFKICNNYNYNIFIISGHSTCLGLTSEALKQIDDSKWECRKCKVCVVCGVKTDTNVS